MSVFNQDIDEMEVGLLDQILNKYDIKDVKLDENPETHLRADRILYVLDKVLREKMDIVEQRDQAESFYNGEIEKKDKNISYLEQMLEYFIDTQDKKTIKLPNGTLKMRTTKKFEYPDKDVIVKFCEERDIPCNVITKPDLSVLKKYIKTTGESPDGMEISEVTRFSYSTKGGH